VLLYLLGDFGDVFLLGFVDELIDYCEVLFSLVFLEGDYAEILAVSSNQIVDHHLERNRNRNGFTFAVECASGKELLDFFAVRL